MSISKICPVCGSELWIANTHGNNPQIRCTNSRCTYREAAVDLYLRKKGQRQLPGMEVG